MDDVIPYTVKARPDTGLYNAKLGIWLFLSSEVMLFGALFSSYILLRLGSHDWPNAAELQNIPLGTFNTCLLITSSVTMILAWVALKENNFSLFRNRLGITILLALVFLCVKAYEYHLKFEHHHFPHDSTYLAIYFTMTGLHALHIIGGVVLLSYHWLRGSVLWKKDPERLTNRVEVGGLYWHFVDLVWLFLFPVMYLL